MRDSHREADRQDHETHTEGVRNIGGDDFADGAVDDRAGHGEERADGAREGGDGERGAVDGHGRCTAAPALEVQAGDRHRRLPTEHHGEPSRGKEAPNSDGDPRQLASHLLGQGSE